jgi:hypothetical protein
LLLQERSIANYIFTTYEETYYNWETALGAGDNRLADLLADQLDYFNVTLLCNSRLLWYWSNDDDPMWKMFTQPIVDYYNRHVPRNAPEAPDGGCKLPIDASGPIPPP